MSKFLEKVKAKSVDLYADPVTVAFLGDSVTQGCFEIYRSGPGSIETIFESESAYSANFKRIFASLYPRVPLNIVNCGISGDNAPRGAARLEKDVLPCHPDLVVVSFGLNDSCTGLEKLEEYVGALRTIFARLRQEGIEAILLTPNMMCSYVDCRISDELERSVAENVAQVQTGGVLDAYMEAARAAARAEGARICDCYAAWKTMAAAGVDTTGLLSNRINHPIRELHWLFAWELVKTVFAG